MILFTFQSFELIARYSGCLFSDENVKNNVSKIVSFLCDLPNLYMIDVLHVVLM